MPTWCVGSATNIGGMTQPAVAGRNWWRSPSGIRVSSVIGNGSPPLGEEGEKSPVTGDCHAGICGSRRVKSPPATRPCPGHSPESRLAYGKNNCNTKTFILKKTRLTGFRGVLLLSGRNVRDWHHTNGVRSRARLALSKRRCQVCGRYLPEPQPMGSVMIVSAVPYALGMNRSGSPSVFEVGTTAMPAPRRPVRGARSVTAPVYPPLPSNPT